MAILNGALFEWEQHAPLLRNGGLREEAMELIRDKDAKFDDDGSKGLLTVAQRAVLRYADSMTKTVTVPDEVFGELKDYFSDQEIVEITATVAAYNCVSRFLVALDVGEKNHLH